jgi:DNA-binding NarL/FixJ family response regulator
MRKINVTIICARAEEYPGCGDLLEDCPEISIVARTGGLYEPGSWAALGRSDILLLDEAAIEQDGLDVVLNVHDRYPLLGSLLIMEIFNKNMAMSALSRGIRGVMERAATVSALRKAIAAIYSGEAWLARGFVEPLRNELIYMERKLHWENQSLVEGRWEKMN